MSAADTLRELAKDLRKGSGACSSSRDWDNGYLAGMQEAANRLDKAAAALDGPLTFRGIPLVFNETMEPDEAKAYIINPEVGEAMRKAGYEVKTFRTEAP
jgi:hypothetical protein